MSAGFMSGGFSGMQRMLQQPTVLGEGYDVAPAGILFGGGLGGLWGRLWVGAKGFGMFAATSPSRNGETTLTGGGGGGEVGYAVVSTEDWLVVPFFGVGGFRYGLAVKNSTPAPLTIFPNHEIPPGTERTYAAGFITGEVGIRANRLLFWGSAGITVGAELGYMSSLQRTAWESGAGATPESAELRGAYFRLVIGGGAFQFRPAHHRPPQTASAE